VTYTTTGKRLIRIWDMKTGRLARATQTEMMLCVRGFSPDGRFLISSEDNGVFHLWRTALDEPGGQIQLVNSIRKHKGYIERYDFSDDLEILHTNDGTSAVIWDFPVLSGEIKP
jgi:WD40 repeat protein